MQDIDITITGNVCTDVTQRDLGDNRSVTSFRLVSSPRVMTNGVWADGPASFFSVGCFGALGRNVFASVHRGDPVVVRGRLRIRTWEADGVTRTSADIAANAVGFDLTLGTATFQRQQRQAPTAPTAPVEPVVQHGLDAGLSAERVQQDLSAA